MRHLISNIVCAFIAKKSLRDKVRTMIRYPQTHEYVRYIRNISKGLKKHKIRTTVGYGCKNFIVILNNERVFKFPLLNDGKDVAVREKRIVDAFYDISPIKIPKMKIIQYKNIFVREYEFATGTLLTDIKPKIISAHQTHIAKQIANFLYVIGKSDPQEIKDLKPTPNVNPGFLYGWFQHDIWQNFMLNTKTFDITYFIDWDQADFEDFKPALITGSHNWDKFGYRGLIVDLMAEYSKLYFQNEKSESIKKK